MAIEAFLKLGDLKGESQKKGFEDQMEVLGWNWDMSQTGTTHDGSKGSGAGKVHMGDIMISRYVDSASPKVVRAVCTGEHFPEGTLSFRKAGGKEPLPYLIVELKKIMIVSLQVGSADSDERIQETMTLNFAEYEYKYQAQKEDGTKEGGEVVATGNIATGEFG